MDLITSGTISRLHETAIKRKLPEGKTLVRGTFDI
jgi:hypothetical protein